MKLTSEDTFNTVRAIPLVTRKSVKQPSVTQQAYKKENKDDEYNIERLEYFNDVAIGFLVWCTIIFLPLSM